MRRGAGQTTNGEAGIVTSAPPRHRFTAPAEPMFRINITARRLRPPGASMLVTNIVKWVGEGNRNESF
jgi:hypothetical protein